MVSVTQPRQQLLFKQILFVYSTLYCILSSCRFIVIVVLLTIGGVVVVGRLISQSINTDEGSKHQREGMIEMQELSTDNEDYAEVPGRVLLPQGC